MLTDETALPSLRDQADRLIELRCMTWRICPPNGCGGRTPLTLTEGLHWLLQRPAVLQRGHCFMTIGSRRRKPDGALDARTPAVWISNGTGRDGAINRDAAKVGWCWAGNRHTWLGFASAASRRSLCD